MSNQNLLRSTPDYVILHSFGRVRASICGKICKLLIPNMTWLETISRCKTWNPRALVVLCLLCNCVIVWSCFGWDNGWLVCHFLRTRGELLLFLEFCGTVLSPLGLGLSWFPGWFWHLQALRSLPFWGSLHVFAKTFRTLCRGLVCRLAIYNSMHRQQALHHNSILESRLEMVKIHQNPGLWWSVWRILRKMFISEFISRLVSLKKPLKIALVPLTAGYDSQASCLYFTQLGHSSIHQIYGPSAESHLLATDGTWWHHCVPM